MIGHHAAVSISYFGHQSVCTLFVCHMHCQNTQDNLTNSILYVKKSLQKCQKSHYLDPRKSIDIQDWSNLRCFMEMLSLFWFILLEITYDDEFHVFYILITDCKVIVSRGQRKIGWTPRSCLYQLLWPSVCCKMSVCHMHYQNTKDNLTHLILYVMEFLQKMSKFILFCS